MIFYRYNLKDYYEKTYYNLILFDALFKKEGKNKEVILDELGIVASTYRKARQKEQRIGHEIVNKLNAYFGLNNIDPKKIPLYEALLSRIMTELNFKTENVLDDEKKLLAECINDNNVLKPIFIMFDILMKISNSKLGIAKLVELTKDDYQLVKSHEKLYTDELMMVYLMIQCFFESSSKIDFNKIDEMLSKNPYAKGMIYYLASSRYFIDGDYNNSLIYAKFGEEIYIKEHNINRLLAIQNNICNLYFLLGKYRLVVDKAEECASAMLCYKKNTPLFLHFKAIYYSSLFKNNNLDEIDFVLNEFSKSDHIDYLFFALLAFRKKDKKTLKNVIKEYNSNGYEKRHEAYKLILNLMNTLDGKISVLQLRKTHIEYRATFIRDIIREI